MYLFVYGPLFFNEVLQIITPLRFKRTKAVLKDYACLRIKGKTVPALVPQPSAITDGFLYADVDNEIIIRIDDFKGDMYQRDNASVTTENGVTVVAALHVTKPEHLSVVVQEPWNAENFRKKHLNEFIRICNCLKK
jgi:hypothetical protein